MAYKTFNQWLENLQMRQQVSQDFLLDFLRGKLGINDNAMILAMPLKDIKGSVISDLLSSGIIKTSNQDIIQRIQNKSGTVKDLVDLMAGQQSAADTTIPNDLT